MVGQGDRQPGLEVRPCGVHARTRRRLLDAIAAVLSRRGFAGTRLSDIAAQARIQAPAIYYYYYYSREG